MKKRISFAEFAIIVMTKARILDFTRVVSVGTRVKGENHFYAIFCEDDMGRETVIEIPYYVNDECEV